MKCALLLLDSHYTDRMVVANTQYECVSELNHKLFYITFRSRHNSRQRTHSLPIFARQIASRPRHVFAQQTRSFMSFYMLCMPQEAAAQSSGSSRSVQINIVDFVCDFPGKSTLNRKKTHVFETHSSRPIRNRKSKHKTSWFCARNFQ